ncbi:pyridoxal phosphate-dependent decarboxylase family protein [Arsenicicoccus dermatophilus]|uniref:pyridoxal phosphate-dependent decarboxylase family protein n=1 Tax=Arsenicicoccus dermatophilus TaxID=1076331 RepID=UPI0039173EB1
MTHVETTTDLLVPQTVEAYEAALQDTVGRLGRHLRAVSHPSAGPCVDRTRGAVAAIDLDAPAVGLDLALDELGPTYLDSAMHFHHPRYAAHLNCPVTIAGLAAELVAATLNSSMDTWDQSGGATHIEQAVVDWTCSRLGLTGGSGVFTPGGTTSNLQALLLARSEARAAGARLEQLTVLATEHGHFSVAKACRALGLAHDAVVPVPVDTDGRMSPDELARTIDHTRWSGREVMAVVATAGTTDLGIVDPLRPIGEVCARAGAWLHVDAAYGGGLVTSTRHRCLLDGVDLADSVTVDFHKTFFVPIGASALVVARPRTLGHVTHHADYLNPAGCGLPNLVDRSMQTTRRFDALKVWLTLRAVGADAIGRMIDEVIDLAHRVADRVEAADDLELHSRPTLSTVVLRALPPDPDDRARFLRDPQLADDVTRCTRRLLLAQGRSIVAGTTLAGRAYLKLTLLNPAATDDDLAEVLDDVRRAARRACDQVLLERGSRPVVLAGARA